MEKHIRVLSIIDIVLGVLTLLAGVGLLFATLLGVISVGVAEPGARGVAGIVAGAGLFLSVVVITIGIFGIVVGANLRAHKPWARIAQIIFGALELPNFPIGTAFGIYALWVMLSAEGSALFEEQREQKAA